MINWVPVSYDPTQLIVKSFHSDCEPIALHVIRSVGLNSRNEQDNGYAYIIVKEDAFSTMFPIEYITSEELIKKYDIQPF